MTPGSRRPRGDWTTRWMAECPRESELSDGSAQEKTLEAAFFQKLRGAPVLTSDRDRQGPLWGLAGTAKELEASDLPSSCCRVPCVTGLGLGADLCRSGGGESCSRAGLPDSNGDERVPGSQKLGHKHVVSGVRRAVRRACPSKS